MRIADLHNSFSNVYGFIKNSSSHEGKRVDDECPSCQFTEQGSCVYECTASRELGKSKQIHRIVVNHEIHLQ